MSDEPHERYLTGARSLKLFATNLAYRCRQAASTRTRCLASRRNLSRFLVGSGFTAAVMPSATANHYSRRYRDGSRLA